MLRLGYLLGMTTAVLLSSTSAGAQVYRLSDGDGTVHFTNAPTDPRYKNLKGYSSGTSAGFLRLPQADTARYADEIKSAAERYGVPERLVQAVIRVESAFNPKAVSVKGAQGLMQLMPETAVVANRGIPPYPETRDYVTRVLYHYDGTTNGGSAPPPMPVYRTVGDDGSIVYTNIPPRGRR